MFNELENRMVIDSEWDSIENPIPKKTLLSLPVCDYCGERIIQEKALFIRSCSIYICDSCIEDAKERTALADY